MGTQELASERPTDVEEKFSPKNKADDKGFLICGSGHETLWRVDKGFEEKDEHGNIAGRPNSENRRSARGAYLSCAGSARQSREGILKAASAAFHA